MFHPVLPVGLVMTVGAECPTSFDVLVIGSGAAGLYTALCLPSHLRIGLVTKETLSLSASDWAQGGIAAPISPDDSPALHIADTLKAGAGLCDLNAVQVLVEQAADCVQHLLSLGVTFDHHGNTLALTLEAAHSRRRVLHSADTTGHAVISTLVQQVIHRENISVLSNTFVLDLWIEGDRCQGISLLHQQQVKWIAAKTVILATGGGGHVFSQTTNPPSNTGDGLAMAWRSGAQLRDLEFVQFHPTALSKAGAPRFLISEAVRGEGAHLLDHQGDRFMFHYHSDGELAPRDVVSRAIYQHLQSDHPQHDPDAPNHVWLDLRSIPTETTQRRFPNIINVCRRWQIDVFQDPIPVAPAAHYWMGGILTDVTSQTTVPGVYAVGETASTGVHGANRLASNSLLECLVFARQLGHLDLPVMSSEVLHHSKTQTIDPTLDQLDPLTWSEISHLAEQRQAVRQLLWQSAGISRHGDSLHQAIAQIQTWRTEFAATPLSQALANIKTGVDYSVGEQSLAIRDWSETRNLLDLAYLTLNSAQFRTESRGGHYRLDFPKTDPSWQCHTLIQGDRWYTSDPIPEPNLS